jgi:cysteine desulfurase/selenocysteine lyase
MTASTIVSNALRPPPPPRSGQPFDVKRVREDFPILRQRVNGKPLVYLDNAATAQKPQVVIDTISRFYAAQNANIHRGVHTLSEQATAAYDQARETTARFLNAKQRTRWYLPAVPLTASTWWRTATDGRS